MKITGMKMKKTESKTKREQKTGKKMNKNKTESVAGKVIKTRTLANGVRIITEKMPHVRSIALGIGQAANAASASARNLSGRFSAFFISAANRVVNNLSTSLIMNSHLSE